LGEVAAGIWQVRLDSGDVVEFSSEREAFQGMSKLKTAAAIVACVQTLAHAADYGADLRQEYFDVGTFVADGEFTDPALGALGVAPEDLVSCVNLLEQFENLMANRAVQQNTWRIILNHVRRANV